jgi:multiple sugar transport system ATP-binding protein
VAEVVFDSVGKQYPDGTRAVRDLDLHVADGELLVLVGPSGCGKTTALRMLAGLEDISEGEIRIGDRPVNDVPPRDRDVAMVFQSYALYPHLTVAENIGFGLKLRKVPKDEIRTRVEEAARVLGLTEHLDRKPRNLSGGQRQRVAMGRAIVRRPQVFLMDEPLSNLDAKLRVQMRVEIARIQRSLNVTTVYVTHDQTEAMTLGDRVAVMKRGQLQQVGPPQHLYDHPVNLFVAGFIGSPAMNLMLAEVVAPAQGPGLALKLGSQTLGVAADDDLADYRGRHVVVGIRPEDMEDARLAPAGADAGRLTGVVELTEALGSDVYVHAAVDAAPVVNDDTKELAADAGVEPLESKHDSSVIVARCDPRTTARPGEPIDLAVSTERLHLFDPDTGRSIKDKERTSAP